MPARTRQTTLASEPCRVRSAAPRLVDTPDARGVLVERRDDMARCVDALHLRSGRPVLVLVGGAAGLDPAIGERVSGLFRRHLLPLLAEFDAVVVDGGTDSGVMACVGWANVGRRVPLVGVAAVGTVAVAGLAGVAVGRTALEPHHSHFLLVPGDQWGDESPWLSLTATVLAGPCPSVTLVVGGGEITRLDVEHSRSAGRCTILLTGSGGVADELAFGLRPEIIPEARAAAPGSTVALTAVDLDAAAEQLPRLLSRLLCREQAG